MKSTRHRIYINHYRVLQGSFCKKLQDLRHGRWWHWPVCSPALWWSGTNEKRSRGRIVRGFHGGGSSAVEDHGVGRNFAATGRQRCCTTKPAREQRWHRRRGRSSLSGWMLWCRRLGSVPVRSRGAEGVSYAFRRSAQADSEVRQVVLILGYAMTYPDHPVGSPLKRLIKDFHKKAP